MHIWRMAYGQSQLFMLNTVVMKWPKVARNTIGEGRGGEGREQTWSLCIELEDPVDDHQIKPRFLLLQREDTH